MKKQKNYAFIVSIIGAAALILQQVLRKYGIEIGEAVISETLTALFGLSIAGGILGMGLTRKKDTESRKDENTEKTEDGKAGDGDDDKRGKE